MPSLFQSTSTMLNAYLECIADYKITKTTLKTKSKAKSYTITHYTWSSLTNTVLFSVDIDPKTCDKAQPMDEEMKGKKKVLRIDRERKGRTGRCVGIKRNCGMGSCSRVFLTESFPIRTLKTGTILYHTFKVSASNLNSFSPRIAQGRSGKVSRGMEDSGLPKNSMECSLPRATAAVV